MITDRGTQLAADGFERIVTVPVGLPHFVWRVDIDVEFDRELRLLEETVLQLIAAGVSSSTEIAELMGLDDGRMVPATLVDLLRRGAVVHRDGILSLGVSGVLMLERATTRESRRYTDVELRHDPYHDELRWTFDEPELKEKDLRTDGVRALPAIGELNACDVEGRYRDLQRLVEREGFPFDTPDDRATPRRREVIRMVPLKSYVAYREAQLEVWHRKDRDEWQWRLLRGGGEEAEVSLKLAELESEGVDIIPLDEREELKVSAKGEVVHAATEEARRMTQPRLLETAEHREALRDAILEARNELIIISPWLRTAAVDQELLGWLRTTLDRNKSLRITVGYGIDREAGRRPDPAARDQEEALRRLRKMGEHVRGRLRVVEVGNTHEKVVVCDDRYVIITSFNFLSFNPRPGKGVRREMGHLITDRDVVARVRATVTRALIDSGSRTT